jgi:hypothetical protein
MICRISKTRKLLVALNTRMRYRTNKIKRCWRSWVAMGICRSVFALWRDSTCISLVGAHLMSRVSLSGVVFSMSAWEYTISADTVLVDPVSVTISLYMQGGQSIGLFQMPSWQFTRVPSCWVSSGSWGGRWEPPNWEHFRYISRNSL